LVFHVKGKVHPVTCHEGPEGEKRRNTALILILGAKWGWLVNATSRPLYPPPPPRTRKGSGTHCTGGCAGARAGLHGCRKCRRDSIPGPSNPGILYRIDLSLFALKCVRLEILRHLTSICNGPWARGLRRGSATAHLLGLRIRIPPGALMSVFCECCQVEVPATGRSHIQRSRTECGVSERVRETSIIVRSWPSRGCCTLGEGGKQCEPVTKGGSGADIDMG
jgi:hypothetical protein